MASATAPARDGDGAREPGEPAHRRDLLRGPLRALGARQLVRPPSSTSPRTRASGARTSRDFERQAALWNYCLFFWGEDAVADNLSPYIDAAPLRGAEVLPHDPAGRRGAPRGLLQALHAGGVRHRRRLGRRAACRRSSPQLTVGFRRIFDRLDTMADELRRDRSPAKLAAAVTLYHVVIEASLAQPGQHFICSYLEERDQLPAFREGMENIAADEQRHIGFGVKLLADLNREDPVGVPEGRRRAAARRHPLHRPGADAARLGRALHHRLRRHLRRGRRRGPAPR